MASNHPPAYSAASGQAATEEGISSQHELPKDINISEDGISTQLHVGGELLDRSLACPGGVRPY